MDKRRDFDLVLQGATGFTGGWALRELQQHAPDGLRWAVAGRNEAKVSALGERFGVPAVIADGLDEGAVGKLAARTRVVLSCAGPFSRYGHPLVAACVREGTHYADLTGELPWIHEITARHHAEASAKGVTLIPSSGFDSVPTDLGVQALAAAVGPSANITGMVQLRGGINGGTLHSGLALSEDLPKERAQPPQRPSGPRIFPVPALHRYAAPFLMAPVNQDVVRRSATYLAEEGKGYGKDFRYHEYLSMRSRRQAWQASWMLSLTEGMLAHRFGRALLRRFGPKPGEGPSEESIRTGYARLTLLAGSLEQPDAIQRWDWKGDPSNLITVRCLVQTGLALAAGEAQRGGVLTPASALGASLLQRLLSIGAVHPQPLAPAKTAAGSQAGSSNASCRT